jgi:ribonuclease HII
MFGRLYVSAVVLPKTIDENKEKNYSCIKDSKKFTSKKKIREVAEFIKGEAIAWSVKYVESDIIDRINIREAVLMAMHQCIDEILEKMGDVNKEGGLLLIDGNDFRPYMLYNDETGELREMPHQTVEKGDSLYYSIAAASILAKVSRDDYMLDLCEKYPVLVERYQLNTNMGYGTKSHLEGIKNFGICQWHRKTYGICKTVETPYIIG